MSDAGQRTRHQQERPARERSHSAEHGHPDDRRSDGGIPAAARHRRAPEHRHLDASPARPGTRRSTTASSTRRRPSRPITFIDGDQGILRYRGYPIEQLAQNSDATSKSPGCSSTASCPAPTSSPSSTSASATTRSCTKTSSASSRRCRTRRTRCRCCRPRSSALSTYYESESDPNNPEHVELNTIRMLAKLPVIAAYAHKKSIGQAFLYPDNSLSFVDNFLKLNFGVLSRDLRDQPGHVAGARASADPARGPRAERVDLDGAAGRLDGREPVLVDLGGHQRALRPAARRRERGRARRCSAASATRARACSASSSG